MPSSTQTQEQIENCIEALKPYALTMTEVFQLINLRPKALIDLTLVNFFYFLKIITLTLSKNNLYKKYFIITFIYIYL